MTTTTAIIITDDWAGERAAAASAAAVIATVGITQARAHVAGGHGAQGNGLSSVAQVTKRAVSASHSDSDLPKLG